MARLMLAMAACLTLGAGGMWVASNFKLKFESVGGPDQPPSPPVARTPALSEPAMLPPHILALAHPQPPTGGVVPASGSLPAALGTAALGVSAGPVSEEVLEVTETVDGTTITWGKPNPTTELKLATDTPTLKFAVLPTDDEKPTIMRGADDLSAIKSAYAKDGTLKLDLTKLPAKPEFAPGKPIKLTITRTIPNTNMIASTVTVVRPRAFTGTETGFTVDRASVTKLLLPADVSTLTGDTAKIVNEYLRVQGAAPDSYLGSSFFTVLDGKPPKPVAQADREPNAGRLWSYALRTRPEDNGKTARVLVRADFSTGEHAYKLPATPFTFTKSYDPLPAPQVVISPATSAAGKFVGPLPASSPRTRLPAVPANTRRLKVSVTLAATARAAALFIDGQFHEARPTATPVVFDEVPVGDGREHAIRVEALLGDTSSPAAQVGVNVVETPPRVDSVTANAFGQSNGAAGGEKVFIRFNPGNPLDPAEAVKGADYEVEHVETKTTGLVTKVPTFDPDTNTVTLVVDKVVPGSYAVRVKADVKDIYGNPLATVGNPKAGFAYETLLFTGGAPAEAAPPSVDAGVTPTGKNAIYPDYTHYREYPDGANPSDRVETRVVRLYYTRDAHRVAQLINREARSYNGPAVAVRRRAADRVRDEADAIQNERQRQERAAVGAAVNTRRAETELKQAEARLQSARDQQVTAVTQLSQRQQQLDQAIRSFGRDQTGIDVRARTDASTDAAARRVTQLQGDIARAKLAVTAAGLTEGSSIPSADQKVLDARNDLSAKQTALATAFATARAAVAGDPTVATATQQRDAIAQQMSNVNTAAADRFALQASLNVAQQRLAEVEQAAILRSPNAATIQTATAAVQTSQLAVETRRAGREALTSLPAQNLSLAEAQRELDRAQAVAGGRAATDTGADVTQDTVAGIREEVRKLQLVRSSAAATEQNARADVDRLRGTVQGLRAEEVTLTEASLGKEGEERRKREEQFRREVAAALADPDTYAAGQPDSRDAVLQCSVSVIGEGLLYLRGPVKGLNIIRTIVNQIDSPTGQVRVGMHTVQVNGENVNKMNKVVENIQRYIDHSRFLTATAAQMLRNAVTTVASRKAIEAAGTLAPECSQADRDQKYLYAFFGKDFIDELKALDSEFLRTGNKVLSLHSMDSTSLASALFLMSLARNDVREEILTEFKCQLQTKLPQAEWEKFVSGLSCPTKCEACFDRTFCMLAQNAKFPGFFGFFNAEVLGADTLTPVQREFVRLAQIFKARLVTEMELKQRVMERTLLEDRVGDFRKEQREAKKKEDMAEEKNRQYRIELQESIVKTTVAFGDVQRELDDIEGKLGHFDCILDNLLSGQFAGKTVPTLSGDLRIYPEFNNGFVKLRNFGWIQPEIEQALSYINRFNYTLADSKLAYQRLIDKIKIITAPDAKVTKEQFGEVAANLKTLFRHIQTESRQARTTIGEMLAELRKERPNLDLVFRKHAAIRAEIRRKVRPGGNESLLNAITRQIDPAFAALQQSYSSAQASARVAQLSRRPLDEKKLLDMLVDDMEEKLIELLDGTRAHTANVDNYLKALATALDDDFTTQFYQPAFKKIRTLGGSWDVQLGQIESTSVLTNNRVLGKVSPTASMEFDLPRRDILIKEAFKDAKAAVQDYGALLNDPVFLSLVKMYGGGGGAVAQFGGLGGLPAVRNVLPGLPGSADEMIMAQAGGQRPEFGTYLENLIPDPAVYKFETGTGYEIRPVLSPDGQAVVFTLDYMYTTDVREPVRADEKHLGRVKRHLLHTDVNLSNYELREVSKYWVSLKAARTGNGVALLQKIPIAGALFRPLPSAGSSLQQNLIYSQAAIFPTLFDLMGLRYAQAVAELSPGALIGTEFVTRGRNEYLRQYIFDYGASRVDDALRILYGERRPDLYRNQWTIPAEHPNGYRGAGLRQQDATLQEGYEPVQSYPRQRYAPGMRLPQRFGNDPFAPTDLSPGLPPIPPGAIIPGHSTDVLPPAGSFGARPSFPAVDMGTRITRQPSGPTPVGRPSPPLRATPPVNAPSPFTAPKTPTQPTIISRSQAPLDPPPGPRVYASDPAPLPRGQFFPR